MHPDDTSFHTYIYGLTLPPAQHVYWVFAYRVGPDKRDSILSVLPEFPNERLRNWLTQQNEAARELGLRVLACVENAWEDPVSEALIRALVQAGHPVQNDAAKKYRAYRADEEPPQGYLHVCSMWERIPATDGGEPEEVCWYVSWSRHSASRWIAGMKWAATNPKNQRPNAPHLQRIRTILASGREPFGRVEATVPAPDKVGAKAGKDGSVPKDMRQVQAAVRDVRTRLGLLAAAND